MKRGNDDDGILELTAEELVRINYVITKLLGLKDISWLEALGKLAGGVLIAKILYKLEKSDLLLVCRVSKAILAICEKYKLMERFYTDSVFMFGVGRRGVLGDGNTRVHVVGFPRQIPNIWQVISVSCGKEHTGLVTRDGRVFMFGNGSFGKLGNGITNNHNVGDPQQIQNIPAVATISCGDNHTGFVTRNGRVFMFGTGSVGRLGDGNTDNHEVRFPLQIQNIPAVAIISCGDMHTGLVTTDGRVFMFGDGQYGKLGNGNIAYHSVGNPQQIQNIPPIANMSCGSDNTGLVTIDGRVFMFGNGSFGNLGNGNIAYHSVGNPQQIQNIPPITSISCGDYHTGLVSTDGRVFMFGDGELGKLGDGNWNDHRVGDPRQIQDIPDVANISCGNTHTGIVTKDGRVFMFGNGESGMLGDGNTKAHYVKLPREIKNIPPITSISCGNTHTGLVSSPESSSLYLPISCQVCGINEALYFSIDDQLEPGVFCGKACQTTLY